MIDVNLDVASSGIWANWSYPSYWLSPTSWLNGCQTGMRFSCECKSDLNCWWIFFGELYDCLVGGCCYSCLIW
jgi:hypothetical protein